MKTLLVFLSASALFVGAAWYRHGDSAHAMGMISVKGGHARHPVHLPAGRERYTLVVTGSIRDSLANSIAAKRNSDNLIEAIYAEDIGKRSS